MMAKLVVYEQHDQGSSRKEKAENMDIEGRPAKDPMLIEFFSTTPEEQSDCCNREWDDEIHEIDP